MRSEEDICRILCDWLIGLGYDVWPEIPRWGGGGSIDVVARRGRFIHAFEAKRFLTGHAIQQAYWNTICAHAVWVVVGSKPQAPGVLRMGHVRIGLITVRTGRVEILQPPCLSDCPLRVDNTEKHMRKDAMGVGGGLPNQAGEGPAQAVARLVDEHKAMRPGATWRELWAAIPNHYSTPSSMAGAMRAVEKREFVRKEGKE